MLRQNIDIARHGQGCGRRTVNKGGICKPCGKADGPCPMVNGSPFGLVDTWHTYDSHGCEIGHAPEKYYGFDSKKHACVPCGGLGRPACDMQCFSLDNNDFTKKACGNSHNGQPCHAAHWSVDKNGFCQK